MTADDVREIYAKLRADVRDGGGQPAVEERLQRRGLVPEEIVGDFMLEVAVKSLMVQQKSGTDPLTALAGMFTLGLLLGLDIADERAVRELTEALKGDAK